MSERLLQSTDLIEIRQNDNTWRKGYINKKERNGKYTIIYVNGELAYDVSTERIRQNQSINVESMNDDVYKNKLISYAKKYADYNSHESYEFKPIYYRNEVVEGNFSNIGQWLECKVIAVKRSVDGTYTYDLLYPDGIIEESIPPNRIRVIDDKNNAKDLQSSPSPSHNSSKKIVEDEDVTDHHLMTINAHLDTRSKFQKGMIVHAKFGFSSNFTKGEIVSCHSDDTYTVKCLKTDILKRVGSEMLHTSGSGPGTDEYCENRVSAVMSPKRPQDNVKKSSYPAYRYNYHVNRRLSRSETDNLAPSVLMNGDTTHNDGVASADQEEDKQAESSEGEKKDKSNNVSNPQPQVKVTVPDKKDSPIVSKTAIDTQPPGNASMSTVHKTETSNSGISVEMSNIDVLPMDPREAYQDIEFGVHYSNQVNPSERYHVLAFMNHVSASIDCTDAVAGTVDDTKTPNDMYGDETAISSSALPYGTEVTVVPKSEYFEFDEEYICTRLMWQGSKVSVPLFMKLKLQPNVPKMIELDLVFYVKSVVVCILNIELNTSSHKYNDITDWNVEQYYSNYFSNTTNQNNQNRVLTATKSMFRSIYIIGPSEHESTLMNYIYSYSKRNLSFITVYVPHTNPALNIDKIRQADCIQFICLYPTTNGTTMSASKPGTSGHIAATEFVPTLAQKDLLNSHMTFVFTELANQKVGKSSSHNVPHKSIICTYIPAVPNIPKSIPEIFAMTTTSSNGSIGNNPYYNIMKNNMSHMPDLLQYKWMFATPGNSQDIKLRLVESLETLNRVLSSVRDRYLPIGMIYLPYKEGYHLNSASSSAVTGTSNANNVKKVLLQSLKDDLIRGVSGSSTLKPADTVSTTGAAGGASTSQLHEFQLMFCCEDQSFTKRIAPDEPIVAHTPINMPFNETFFVNAYPFLKATIAILLVMKLNYKEATNVLKEYSFPVPYNVNKLASQWDEEVLISIWNFYENKLKLIRGVMYQTQSNALHTTSSNSLTYSIDKSFNDINLSSIESKTVGNMITDFTSTVLFSIDSALTSLFHDYSNNHLSHKTYKLKYILDKIAGAQFLKKIHMRPVEINDCTFWISKYSYDKNWCHVVQLLERMDKFMLYEIIHHIVTEVNIKNKQTSYDMAICLRAMGYETWSMIIDIFKPHSQFSILPPSQSNNGMRKSRIDYKKSIKQEQHLSVIKTIQTIENCLSDCGISGIATSKFIEFLHSLNVNDSSQIRPMYN